MKKEIYGTQQIEISGDITGVLPSELKLIKSGENYWCSLCQEPPVTDWWHKDAHSSSGS